MTDKPDAANGIATWSDVISRASVQPAARESRATALTYLEAGDLGPGPIEDLFDRWEVQISEREVSFGRGDDPDGFEHEFSREEDDAELRGELEALRASHTEVSQ